MPASIEFVIGRAGSGKSRLIGDRLKHAMEERRHAVLIVPEQFTFETERALGARLGGLLGIEVLNFTRLCERILNDRGGRERPYLSSQGRCMIIRRAVYRSRSELTAFAGVAHYRGFAQRMDELFALCKRFFISPEHLSDAAQQMSPQSLLHLKLNDIAHLYQMTQEYLNQHYLDNEDAFSVFLEKLPDSRLAGADVYIDGFDLLTEQLYAAVRILMQICKSVTITLCLSPEAHPRDDALFTPEKRIYHKLLSFADELGCPVRQTNLMQSALYAAPQPAFLERELFAYPNRVFEDDAQNVTIFAASDRTAEVEHMADAILTLARQGVRYRDMSVIVSDMPSYAPLVQRACKKRGIPLFLDVKQSIRKHAAVELMHAAVHAVCSGFPVHDILRLLKTDLLGIRQDTAELFENYLLLRGLGPKSLQKPFPQDEETEELELARRRIMEPLLRLKEGMRDKTAAGKTKALYAYLEELQIGLLLSANVEQLRAEGRYALMNEHAQVWNIIVELLDQLYSILDDTTMSSAEYLAVLEEALCAYDVGVIPATADQVLLGTLERTRSRSVHALFVLGCNEGLLPKAYANDGLIDDKELARLSQIGLMPWGDSKSRAQNERMHLYRAFSKAKQQLWIGFSYHINGAERMPSSLVERIQALFPHCAKKTNIGQAEQIPACAQSGFSYLVSHMRAEHAAQDPALSDWISYYTDHEQFGSRLSYLLRKEPLSPPPFGAPLSRKLYGRTLISTASRVEQFNRCPFRHFVRYGLGVMPRREFREKKQDIGILIHDALDAFVKYVCEHGFDWTALGEQQVSEIIDALMPNIVREHNQGILLASARAMAQAEQIITIIKHSALAIAMQLGAGSFRPIGSEVRFGPGEVFPPLTIRLDDGTTALLCGVIDRVDKSQSGDTACVRVVDYKTGTQSFAYEDIVAGIKLQLPLYLLAAASAEKNALPAGMFYLPVNEPVLKEESDNMLADVVKQFRMDGIALHDASVIDAMEEKLDGTSTVMEGIRKNKDGTLKGRLIEKDGMQALLDYSLGRTRHTLEQMMKGVADVSPIAMGQGSACDYCEYRSVCRFDYKMPGAHVRRIRTLNQEAFLEHIQSMQKREKAE